jgi:putative membrane protein
MMYGWSMGLEGWLWMGIWILVLALLIWFLVREPRYPERDEAMEVLRSRLARGELSPEEFEHARQLLEGPRRQENPR